MADDLTGAEAEVSRLHTELLNVVHAWETQRNRVDAAEAELERLRTELERRTRQRDYSSNGREHQLNRAKQAEAERDDARADHAGAERRLKVAQQNIDIKDQAITEYCAAIERIRRALDETFDGYDGDDTAAEIERLFGHIKAYEQDVNRILDAKNKALAKAEAAIERVRERLDALIADGFGATTQTLRDLRTALDTPTPTEGETP